MRGLQGRCDHCSRSERTALNFLQRLSGIATLTAQFVAAALGTRAAIYDTRKTTPGWRALEKYAVRCGGGHNHRFGLFDAVLIKDNHLAYLQAAAGTHGADPISTAIAAAKAGAAAGTTIEIEVDSLDQLVRAFLCAPDIILLDNLGPERVAEAVRLRDARAPRVLLEASGGVSLASVRALAQTGVDRISVGRSPTRRRLWISPSILNLNRCRMPSSCRQVGRADTAPETDRNAIVSSTASGLTHLNMALLDRLRLAGGQHVPLSELGPAIERVHDELDALASFGFGIEQHPYRGAAFTGPAERLCPDQIEYGLSPRWIGRRIAVWNRVTSTNDLAARAGASASNDGLVVLAEEQTAGRGRRGRSWTAPPRSSILMSVLVFPPEPPAPQPPEAAFGCVWLTVLAAIATADVVVAWTGCDARIKWPNDVRVSGRKIAGILVERALTPVWPASARESAHDRGRLGRGHRHRAQRQSEPRRHPARAGRAQHVTPDRTPRRDGRPLGARTRPHLPPGPLVWHDPIGGYPRAQHPVARSQRTPGADRTRGHAVGDQGRPLDRPRRRRRHHPGPRARPRSASPRRRYLVPHTPAAGRHPGARAGFRRRGRQGKPSFVVAALGAWNRRAFACEFRPVPSAEPVPRQGIRLLFRARERERAAARSTGILVELALARC